MRYTENNQKHFSEAREVVFTFFQYGIDSREPQTAEAESQQWTEELETYLVPVNERLDAYLDRRVVGNLMTAVAGIVTARAPLTTSELGSAFPRSSPFRPTDQGACHTWRVASALAEARRLSRDQETDHTLALCPA